MAVAAMALGERLARLTREGSLYERLDRDRVRCFACGHRCLIPPGLPGICKVRFNEAGRLRVPHGYVGALQVDPIEKKPFFHALPGARALSFGMLGCDLHCGYCQNWLTSQALRDPAAVVAPDEIGAAELVALAHRHGAQVITSTYNEPLITSEWAGEVFQLASRAGLVCSYDSNGNATPEVLDFLQPWVRLYKVDLKSFRDRAYRELGGTLERVTETLRGLVARGLWVEVVTLLVPGFNESADELSDLTGFLAGLSPDIPWHVTAFHRDYRMFGPRDTSPAALLRAAEIGRRSGLRFVYAGNLPGHTGDLEDTRCPGCGTTLLERRGFRVLSNRLRDGCCPACARRVPGVWTVAEAQARARSSLTSAAT